MLTNEQENKYLKWTSWALFFLMLGFLSSPTVVSLYHIVIVIPAILYFIKGSRIKIPTSAWVLVIFTIWGLITNLVNMESLIKPHRAYQELKFYFFGFLFLPILTMYFKKVSAHQVKKLINIVSFVAIVAFFVGISKAWFGFDPVKFRFGEFHERSGGFTNYMRYGYASAFLALLGLGVFFNRKKMIKYISPKMFYPAWILSFMAIATSQTRGALLALSIGVPVILLKYKPKLAKVVIALGVVFGSVVIYCSFIDQSITKSRFLNINQASNSVRMTQFQSATKSIEEKPIFGLGADQFSYNVKRLKETYDIDHKQYSGHAHNIMLEHGANYGVVGLAIFLLFMIFWAIEMIKRKDDLGWIVLSYIAAFFVAGQVENLFDNTNSHLFFFIYALSQVYHKLSPKEEV